MSEMTQCNFCSLRDILARAKRDGLVVTTKAASGSGTDVFVHPVSEKEPWRNRKEYWYCWFMELTTECTC